MNLNRRQVLWAGGTTGAAMLLAACGGGGESSAKSPAKGNEKPRPGGTLRVGALGRASAITRDPHGTQANESDYLIISLVHDNERRWRVFRARVAEVVGDSSVP